MKLEIKVSPRMETYNSPLGSVENRLIRIPSPLRWELKLITGRFLNFKTKDGTIALQIAGCYANDLDSSNKCAYVSRDTYSMLDVEHVPAVAPADRFLIGCDPEFFLTDKRTGFSVSASHFFPQLGEIGNDCGLAELRPRPHYDEKLLTKEIKELLLNCFQHVSNNKIFDSIEIEMVAASHFNNTSAGFHIHFGLPSMMLIKNSRNASLLNYISMILDYYVGIPSILPEGNEDNLRRSVKCSKYGKPADFRQKRYTLEYRVPGGHLIRHPILTSGLIALSLVVMKDIISRTNMYLDPSKSFENYNQMRDLYPNLPPREEVYDALISENIGKSVKHKDTILSDVSKMIGFGDNREPIFRYFRYISMYLNGRAKFDENMETNWRLSDNERQQRSMAVFC